MIDDTIFIVRLESDPNCQSELDDLKSESSTIQFGNPNFLSLEISKVKRTGETISNVKVFWGILKNLSTKRIATIWIIWIPDMPILKSAVDGGWDR